MIFSPNDTPVKKNKSDISDSNFGGNRELSAPSNFKGQDYTLRSQFCGDVKNNPIKTVTKDIDDLADSKARKREFSRRAETSAAGDHNKSRFSESDPENRPPEGMDVVIIPDEKYTGTKLKNQFGNGQYDTPNRRNYEGEIS